MNIADHKLVEAMEQAYDLMAAGTPQTPAHELFASQAKAARVLHAALLELDRLNSMTPEDRALSAMIEKTRTTH